jgi:glycosyltransferase involved in cell wall biosynthesis
MSPHDRNEAWCAAAIRDGLTVAANGVRAETALDICIPTFRTELTQLVRALSVLPGAERTQLLIYDDGSGEEDLTNRTAAALQAFPGPAAQITACDNVGRARARNRLAENARSPWVLFLDADMLPDRADFLNRYLAVADADAPPALYVGGFTLDQTVTTPRTALHAAQSLMSECLPAATRAKAPGQYVFTSNVMVHRSILDRIPFDTGFVGWGWEDTDWAFQIGERFAINHIDNPASHMGLDTDNDLIRKYGVSGPNFASLVARHPVASRQLKLYKVARRLSAVPGHGLIAGGARLMATAAPNLVPMPVRLFGLKLYRAAVYAKAIR